MVAALSLLTVLWASQGDKSPVPVKPVLVVTHEPLSSSDRALLLTASPKNEKRLVRYVFVETDGGLVAYDRALWNLDRVDLQLKGLEVLRSSIEGKRRTITTAGMSPASKNSLLDIMRGSSFFAEIGALMSTGDVAFQISVSESIVLRDANGREVRTVLRSEEAPPEPGNFYRPAPSDQEVAAFKRGEDADRGTKSLSGTVIYDFVDPGLTALQRSKVMKLANALIEKRLEEQLAASLSMQKALLDEVGARLSGLAQGSSLGLTTEQQREHIRSQLRVDGAFTSEADVKRFIDEARVISAKPRIDLVTGLLIGGERRSYYIEASANRR